MSMNIPKVSFGTVYPTRNEIPVDSKLSRTERAGVAVSSMLGVAGSLAILAKTAKWKQFSLNPKRILNTKIKDTYLAQVKFEEPEIIAMGAGSITGGLVGGVLIDDRSSNTAAEVKSKVGEALIQMGNITVPILTVGQSARWGDKLEKGIEARISPNTGKFVRSFVKIPKLVSMAIGLGAGMYAGNIGANYLKKTLLDSPQERKMKFTDMFMHWDDLCLAASFYAGDPEVVMVDGVATKVLTTGQKITQGFARLLPVAMMMAGYQVGCKGLERAPKRRADFQSQCKECNLDKNV